MPITTSPSPSYIARAVFMAVLCIGFSVWGAYDLWVKIPHREQVADRFDALSQRLAALETTRLQRQAIGQLPEQQDIDEYTSATQELKSLSPTGEAPARPSKFDRLVQWIYITCLPFGIVPIVSLVRVRKQRYQLDDAGALHFSGDRTLGSGVWTASDIADIDMHRWMAKSIAWVVKGDGTRMKLDAYLHKNLDGIVGAIASSKYPDKWDAEARPVKPAGEAEPPDDRSNETADDALSEKMMQDSSESGLPGANL